MKNITKLLLTSALVAGVSSVSFADAPIVTVGGKVDSRLGVTSQKSDYKTSGATTADSKNARTNMSTSAKVSVKAEGRNDAGLVYGVQIDLDDLKNAKLDNDAADDVARIRRSFVYFDSAMGRIELGNQDAASKSMKVDATNIARASGGIDGDALSFVNDRVGYMDIANSAAGTDRTPAQYLTDAELHADESSSVRKYNKVTYYTPDMNGLKFGISYAGDNESRGGLSGMKGKDFTAATAVLARTSRIGFTNIFSGSLAYDYAIDNVAIKLGASGQYGKAKKNLTATANSDRDIYHNLRAYNVGAVVSYANISLAGSYGDNGKSGNTKETDIFNTSKAKYYTAGASIVQGPIGLSVTNFSSKRMKNKFDMLSVGADYEVAKGALAYVEGNFFSYKPEKSKVYTTAATGTSVAASKNSGSVVLVGAKLNF
ncbi:porin [Rickettsiales endosymbiont of Stachyamoeba lipophora]|uniref:porin n=1 Tax=Rickettsiales endosymbiont of Stachyamoeba lipophora TaxID=2486578 RepID=UPI000F65553F|nr:porin [Rickettsiales endosymbiont of Stachyamoeba lipophora]AZL15697.1 porin [Rickettsiales endosymbiont of Stachyamoeba lipophora]